MVSNSLRQLRGAAQEIADIYNPFPPVRTQAIQNISLSVPDKLNRIWAAANRATSALINLQDSCNQAEAKIRAASQPANADVNEAAVRKVFYAFDHGMELLSVCELLVADNDRDGFNALSANLRLLTKANKLGYPQNLSLDRKLTEARETIATNYQKIASREELMLTAEVEELWNMSRLRASFAELLAFFQTQLLPQVIAGQQNRIEAVNNWMGLGDEAVNRLAARGIEWDRLPKVPRILLGSDVINQSRNSYSGAPLPGGWTTNADSYQITGVSGGQVQTQGWVDKPLDGSGRIY